MPARPPAQASRLPFTPPPGWGRLAADADRLAHPGGACGALRTCCRPAPGAAGDPRLAGPGRRGRPGPPPLERAPGRRSQAALGFVFATLPDDATSASAPACAAEHLEITTDLPWRPADPARWPTPSRCASRSCWRRPPTLASPVPTRRCSPPEPACPLSAPGRSADRAAPAAALPYTTRVPPPPAWSRSSSPTAAWSKTRRCRGGPGTLVPVWRRERGRPEDQSVGFRGGRRAVAVAPGWRVALDLAAHPFYDSPGRPPCRRDRPAPPRAASATCGSWRPRSAARRGCSWRRSRRRGRPRHWHASRRPSAPAPPPICPRRPSPHRGRRSAGRGVAVGGAPRRRRPVAQGPSSGPGPARLGGLVSDPSSSDGGETAAPPPGSKDANLPVEHRCTRAPCPGERAAPADAETELVSRPWPATSAPGALHRAHAADVYRVARRFVDGDAEAEEVTQEAFVAAFRYIDRSGLLPAHLAVPHHRQPGAEAPPVADAAPRGRPRRHRAHLQPRRHPRGRGRRPSGPGPAPELPDRLEPRKRAVLVLHELEGLDTREIADILGARARRSLRASPARARICCGSPSAGACGPTRRERPDGH
ncbi:MAG: sigma-70 family RNA polymerase sigma factor [bacterium]